MKKKSIIWFAILPILCVTFSCGKDETRQNGTIKVEAEAIMNEFKSKAPNCGEYVVFDAKSDPNSLLGKENQYNQKINFEVTTVRQSNDESPKGGSIEVFDSEKDAVNRKDYITSIGEKMPLAIEYDYVNSTVLLRMDRTVDEDDYNEYKNILDEYIETLRNGE